MRIDTAILDARFRKYMSVPGSRRTWDELTNSVVFNVTASLCLAVVALVLICTLIMAWTGITMLYGIIKSFVTLEIFHDPRQEYLDHPERMRALILCMIITGGKGHAIMLGTLSDETQADAPFLERKAAEFAAIYLDESGDGEGELFDLMRDDRFQFFRRRAVPASHSEGRDLILFDVDYDLEEIHYTKRSVAWAAAVITIDEPDATATDADPTRLLPVASPNSPGAWSNPPSLSELIVGPPSPCAESHNTFEQNSTEVQSMRIIRG